MSMKYDDVLYLMYGITLDDELHDDNFHSDNGEESDEATNPKP